MMNTSSLTHAFEPAELAFLQRFFDGACVERGLPGGSVAANNLAAQIIQLYQQGVRDEQDLNAHLGGEMLKS
jgi:hypothetical protein